MVGVSVASDPPVLDARVSAAAARAVDVVVRWGSDCVLAAVELSPPRPFFVGEEEGCDVVLPAEITGASRVPVLLARWDGDVRAVVPKGARVVFDGEGKPMTPARAVTRGLAESSRVYRDAAEIPLGYGRTIAVRMGPFTIEITGSDGAPRAPKQPVLERRTGLSHLASVLIHLLFFAAVASRFRPIDDDDFDGVTDDQKFFIQQMLNRSSEREMEGIYADEIAGLEYRARRRQKRNRAEMDLEAAWMRSLQAAGERWSAEEFARARAGEPEDAREAGLIGLLYERPPQPAPTAAPNIPPEDPPKGRTQTQPRPGAMALSGRLPPEVVRRIIRQNFGRFRLCYENGLRRNPNLQGRVAVRFVIGADGAVSNVGNGGSDMPDGGVVSCIVHAFEGLSFPRPDGGIVTVVYPLMFAPGG
ncbi:AgmX/PglI C-terminal domain-containing protein [Polyangium sp. y55x31]|uniref:AgmX/PglI C-terminal domain-containing protein n=1 Tax=Polyangium sp. y55x31 TaxID=3042688 RepID=UPI002482A24E|nr:AgmX/PglI C-terminal domain-containing protein [Polyangium sp. y55x31]MDI1477033.1 AgmX/PglI C-terminal domain-containing protein [Polyangium sp. y55x31]